jgi:hypothetical protein
LLSIQITPELAIKYIILLLSLSEALGASISPEMHNKMQGDSEHVVVNIVTPPDGLGGFGDLVSNLYMGEQLSKEGIKIKIFSLIVIFFPSFKP